MYTILSSLAQGPGCVCPLARGPIVLPSGAAPVTLFSLGLAGQILLFYFFFYSFLAAMFALCLYVLLLTVSPFTPTYRDRVSPPGRYRAGLPKGWIPGGGWRYPLDTACLTKAVLPPPQGGLCEMKSGTS